MAWFGGKLYLKLQTLVSNLQANPLWALLPLDELIDCLTALSAAVLLVVKNTLPFANAVLLALASAN